MWKKEFSVICLLILSLITAHVENNYSHMWSSFRVSKLLWRLHGASLEGLLKKSLCRVLSLLVC